MSRDNKHKQILKHLQNYQSITSWEAIQNYGATRLSSIIFNLRKKGYDIESVDEIDYDRNGNKCKFTRYYLRGEIQ